MRCVQQKLRGGLNRATHVSMYEMVVAGLTLCSCQCVRGLHASSLQASSMTAADTNHVNHRKLGKQRVEVQLLQSQAYKSECRMKNENDWIRHGRPPPPTSKPDDVQYRRDQASPPLATESGKIDHATSENAPVRIVTLSKRSYAWGSRSTQLIKQLRVKLGKMRPPTRSPAAHKRLDQAG